MTQKQMAIKRCAVFLSDRIDYAMTTRDKQAARVRPEDIQALLDYEFEKVPEGGEAVR
jgi:hypothetical protein